MPVPDLWIPPKIDIDNLPDIDDPEKALKAIRTAQDFFVIPRGKNGGKPFTLVSWMWLAEWQIFGKLKPDGTRQYERVFVFIPKKNGKSPWLARMSMYFLLFDGEYEPVVVNVAVTSKQAGHIYNPIIHAIKKSITRDGGVQWPYLSRMVKIFASRQEIECYSPNGGIIKRLTGDRKAKQGEDPSCICADEVGEWVGQAGRELWSTVTDFSQDGREQPICIAATTANVYRPEDIYQDLKEEALVALANPEIYPDLLPIMYYPTPQEEKAIRAKEFPSDETIKRLNPGYDEVMPFERIKRKLLTAFHSKNDERWQKALCFRLNADISGHFQWMRHEIWNACDFGEIDIDKIIKSDSKLPKKERPEWYIGIDLAPSQDLTAWVAIRAPRKKGEKVIIHARAYLPQDRIERHAGIKDKPKDKDGKAQPVRKDAARYIEWEKAGWLTTVPGKVNDDAAVISDISAFIKLIEENGGDLQGIAIDPAHSKRVMTYFIDQGYENWVNQYKNTFDNSSEPCGDLMNHAIEELISHGGNPALSWCVLNLVMVRSQNDEIKPVKNRAADRIDIAIALILAWQCWFRCRDADYL